MERPRVLIVTYTVAGADPRVLRQVEALRGAADITVAAKAGSEMSAVRFVDIGIGVGPEGRISWSLRRAIAALLLLVRSEAALGWFTGTRVRRLGVLRGERFDVVVANDVECLPAVYRYLGGVPRVVLDAHEFAEDEFPERIVWRVLVHPLLRRVSRRYLPRVDGMMTVSAGLAELFEERYGCRAEVVMSADAFVDLDPSALREDVVRMVHVGGHSPVRGLDTLCETVELLGEGYTLDFYLIAQSGYEGFRRRWEGHPRITFHEPVPMGEVARTVNAYDIGAFSLPPTSLNAIHVLPNKFFQFVHGRVAVAIGPSEEMARLVCEYGCGMVAEDFSAEALAAAIAPLTREDLWRMKLGSDAAAAELNLERFAQTIRKVVLPELEQSS